MITSIDVIVNVYIASGEVTFDAHWMLNGTIMDRLIRDTGASLGFYESWLYAIAVSLEQLNEHIDRTRENECVISLYLVGDGDNTFHNGITGVTDKLCAVVKDLPPKPASVTIERAVRRTFNYNNTMAGFDLRIAVVNQLLTLKDKFAIGGFAPVVEIMARHDYRKFKTLERN